MARPSMLNNLHYDCLLSVLMTAARQRLLPLKQDTGKPIADDSSEATPTTTETSKTDIPSEAFNVNLLGGKV